MMYVKTGIGCPTYSPCRMEGAPTFDSLVAFRDAMALSTRIYLTGFMGSGKSTVAPRVARRLGYAVVDLDDRIAEHLGMSIPAIFDVLGEQAFREAEGRLLRDVSDGVGVVVSLGGGSLHTANNLEFCLERGLLVWLRASPRFLESRLEQAQRSRPLLQDENGRQLTGNSLRERIAGLPMITERVGLDDLPTAFQALFHPTTQCKIILEP